MQCPPNFADPREGNPRGARRRATARAGIALAALLAMPLVPPVLAQSVPAGADSAPAAATGAPDPVDLQDIREFSRVYEIVRQAYVEQVSNKTLMRAAITGMLSELDPHSEYLDKQGLEQLDEDTTGQYSGLGIEVLESDGVLRIISPIDDTPAARAGIKPGDSIVRINGTLVGPDNIETMYKNLRGPPGSRITLTVLHEKSAVPVTLKLTRETISLSSVKTRDIEPGYAYIRLSQFQADTAADLQRKLGALIKRDGPQKGAVLDLRNNPGGLLTAAVAVSDDFLDRGIIVTTRGRIASADMSFSAHSGDLLGGAPMVVLTNNGTASAAEIVAGALKDNHRALIMGQRTFGKGVVQTVIPLDADHAVKITTARYYTPNGTSIQAEGIRPDIALGDLAVKPADSGPFLIASESDLPHHLANVNGLAAATASNDGSDQSASIATRDYALSQALNVLKGLALEKGAGRSAEKR